ncbi:MAG TPA: pilus assembly protein TadG-related protein [Gemmatimonadaceae bacterium]|nr:pilus assembly protein TadG-related protein [Gemmatimonadaceae bacterium]
MNIVHSRKVRMNDTRLGILRERRGAMLVFIAVAGVILMGFLAMTLDIGAGSRERRIAQTAADAAAIGGAQEIFRNHTDLVVSAATSEAVRNGYAAGLVTVNYPPATGPYAGNSQYVEVLINKSIPTIFGSIFNVSSMNVQARGVAGVASYSLNCVYTLDPSGAGALTIESGKSLNTNCGVSINSSSSSALDLSSSGDLVATGAAVGITGNYAGGGGASVTPTPVTGIAPVPNPLVTVVMPTVGSCTFATRVVVTGTMTLNPGVYCGGIQVSNSSAQANLNPGTYILAGGGLSVTNSGRINGTGVTLINTTGPFAFQPFTFGSGCKSDLRAPTSGAFSGIVMFQDPAAPSTPGSTFACSSDNGDPELTGTVYLPNSSIDFDGSNSSTTILGAVIARQVIVGANLTVIADTSGNNAVKRLSLVQ